MLGVFMALDFFLFYVFWEVMLLPMYFLIGIWGGPRREYAAIKFFLFTLVGSVLMLIAMLMLYFTSDLTTLSPPTAWPPCHGGAEDAADEAPAETSRSTRSTSWPWPRSASSTDSPFNATLLWGKSLAVVGVPAAVHRLRHQGAHRAGPHVVARRPRRGPHADLDDPGRRAA